MRKEIIGRHTLYLGDCLEILPEIGEVDAVVTDPPYSSGGFTESAKKLSNGMGNRSETRKREGWFYGDSMTTAGISWLLRNVLIQSHKKLPHGGTAAIFTDWRMITHLAPVLESARLRFQNLIVWNKDALGIGTGFRAQHEMIMLFAKGTPNYFNLSHGNVLTVKKVPSSQRQHCTEKPVELFYPLLTVLSPEGGTILDPFMGSGTTGVACENTGRRFIGIEIEEKYFDIACRRVDQAVSQGKFDFGEKGWRDATGFTEETR
jgi:site-specific DNA-methyltransferase (adenine-specific)